MAKIQYSLIFLSGRFENEDLVLKSEEYLKDALKKKASMWADNTHAENMKRWITKFMKTFSTAASFDIPIANSMCEKCISKPPG